MAGPFETGGYYLGGLIGAANGGATQAGPAISEGMTRGFAAGGAGGAVFGTLVEPGGGTFVGGALGAPLGAGLGGVGYGTGPFIHGAIAGAPGGAAQGQSTGKGIDDAISGWWHHILNADNKADEHSDQPADQCTGQCPPTSTAKPGEAFPDRKLPRDKNGRPVPDPEAEGTAHTQLGTQEGRRVGKYPQAREFDENGDPIRDRDFTDHGRPDQHTDPHQHQYIPNPTGGTPQKGDAEPF